MSSNLIVKGRVLSKIKEGDAQGLISHNHKYDLLYNRSIVNGKMTPVRAIRLATIRKRYLERLREIPFSKEMLEKQIKFSVPVNGRVQNFSLFKNGIAFEGLSRPVVMVIFPFGKGQFFYKSTGVNSKKPGAWLPIRGVTYTKFKNGEMNWWYQKYEGHPNFPEYLIKIGEEISKKESEIDFKKNWNVDQVEAMKQYFG